ncbi:HIRAN domain-containing protein [Arthrobacter agilis]|uniref:HIRAN domain-containing protein n=1 Tax=Arthrobacter agilis TaxID=37921 RepID=UPI0023672579|nr:HIRAN domain-containing protein [Arthrobacter agilis]WDF34560.1 HIRAN domain-containing protein [Arthrobacter agilis]
MSNYYLPGRSTWQNMEVVGEKFREKQLAQVLGRKPRLDEQIEQEHEAELVPEPDNPHDANAISVRIKGRVVGYLSRDDAARFVPVLHRIAASGHTAVTSARIWATTSRSWSNEKRIDFHSRVTIFLPEPNQVLPLNWASLDGVAVLPWGGALQVTGEDKHFDHLFNYVPTGGEGMVILTLHKLIHTLKNGTERELVEVRLDGERVGQLTAATSGHYLPTISHASDMGKHLGIWARIKGSGLAAELVIQGARATDLDDAWLRSMPSIPMVIPERPSYSVPPAFTEWDRIEQPSVARQVPPEPEPMPGPKTQAKQPVVLTPEQLKHSPTVHRAAGVSMIILGVLLGSVLALIPVVGPVLFIGCVVFGIVANVRWRKVAAAVEESQKT